MNDLIYILVMVTAPLVGGLLAYYIRKSSRFITVAASLISFLLAVIGLMLYKESLYFSWEWLPGFELSIHVDSLGFLLVALVSFISFLVLVFSTVYMANDQSNNRYFAKLGLFIFSMIGLLLADHLLLLFIFWELVGFSSYLLIGFWYSKSAVPESARIAFMINRVADACLLVGILLLYNEKNSFSLLHIAGDISMIPSLLIMIGAFGKSAQFPFSGWLIKAMVGPTPVSALIHAATMVAAGVYLLVRAMPFLHESVLLIIAIIGVITAFYGALCAIIQFDIKRVLAFSTISQLGYMMVGVGVGAVGASLFHLFTHAFFKAGLFLGAASIMHYLGNSGIIDKQDMRYMGGLNKKLPRTYRSFLICGLALAGLPLFSGFMSKDAILISSWNFANDYGTWAYVIPDMALITAMLTSFYVGRMILLVFWGQARFSKELIAKEGIKVTFPLMTLAVFSIWIMHNLNPFDHQGWIFETLKLMGGEHESAILIPFLSVLLALVGILLAYSFFKPGTSYEKGFAKQMVPVSAGTRVLFNGFYLTSAYSLAGHFIVFCAKRIARIDQKLIDPILHLFSVSAVVIAKVIALMDRFLIDGPVNLVAKFSSFVGKRLAGLSSKDGQTQLSWLLFIVILILSIILFF